MRVPVAREGFPFVVSTAGPAVVLVLAAEQVGGPVLWTLAIIISVLALAVIGFFRDPERSGPKSDELILSPADGKVIKVDHVEESSFFQGEAPCISIFLSLFDVHVNRYPVSGDVKLRDYEPGRFEPAWRASASHSNERASTGIDTHGQPVLVNQIAGLAAKRIITYAEIGDKVQQGDRMGLIRFGSRVDIYMPKDTVPSVKVGERAVGGVTVLAQMPSDSENPE